MLGLGYRQEMKNWDFNPFPISFCEIAPENWTHANTSPLQKFKDVRLHGVSLNLGGTHPINLDFLSDIKNLIQELKIKHYSDHLSSTGNPYLYDLFPVPFTKSEATRVADRIKLVQDFLGMRIGIENATYYTNTGNLKEYEFLSLVSNLADCSILLDINNIIVNWDNHKQIKPTEFIENIDLNKVSYLHVAAPNYDEDFNMWLDSHSGVPSELCLQLAASLKKDILFEWDNQIGDEKTVLEVLCKISSIM